MSVIETPTEVPCESCGAQIASGVRFCPECGRARRLPGARPGFGLHYAAFLVDVTVVIGLWLVVSFLAQPFARLLPIPDPGVDIGRFRGSATTLLGIVLLPVVGIFYSVITDGLRGRSVGKKIAGISVRLVGPALGARPGVARGLIRALVLWGPLLMLMAGQLAGLLGQRSLAIGLVRVGAPALVVIWIGSLGMMLFWRQRRGLHDLAAGTQTVID